MLEAFQRAIGRQANEIAGSSSSYAKDGSIGATVRGDLDGMIRTDVWAGRQSTSNRSEVVDKPPSMSRSQIREFYQQLGLTRAGQLFHCSRDFATWGSAPAWRSSARSSSAVWAL
jgi:hypothetical protein